MPTKSPTQNGVNAKAGKAKKTVRSAAPAAPKKTISRKKAAPKAAAVYAETLFTAEPNPYHQPVAPYLWIDHPQQDESLSGSDYAIRIGVGGAEVVELSIDNSPWLACRATSGYWWFDWSGITPGSHTLVARMKTHDGSWYRTPERKISRNG